MNLTALALLACTAPPPTAPATKLTVVGAEAAPDGLTVQWSLAGADGATTVAGGTVRARLYEHDVRQPEAVVPLCEAEAPITAETFRGDRGWAAFTTLVMDCPPPTDDADHYRDLEVVYGDLSGHGDPPPAWRTPIRYAEAGERRRAVREHERFEQSRRADAEWRASLAALAPLIPDGEPPATSCGDVAGEAAPRFEWDALGEVAGPAPAEPQDLVWVRRTTSRREGAVSYGKYLPGAATGALYLVARSPARVVCGAPFTARNDPAMDVAFAIEGAAGLSPKVLTRDLDDAIDAATEKARASLTGEQLTFAAR